MACGDDDHEPDVDTKPDARVTADGGRDAQVERDAAVERDAQVDIDAGRDLMDAQIIDARLPEVDATFVDAFVPVFDAGFDAAVDAGPPDAGPVCDAMTAPVLPSLALQPVQGATATNLVYARQPPGSSDWYLVELGGTVRVLSNGVLATDPFIDVRAELPGTDERGLLGIAFPPDYASSGRLYVAMTAVSGDFPNQDTVYEYQRAQDGKTATRTRPIVQLPMSAANHNGGTVLFGPDGFLYYGTGDGGGGCNSDKPGAAQDPKQLFGKILRLDPNASAPFAASGNPFSGDAGDPRVFHYGLRNPFRFAFDRLTGGMFIGDVGQNAYEELDYVPPAAKGLNFGWPKFEGDHMDTCGTDPMLALNPGDTDVKPIVEFSRPTAGPFMDYVSVIGGPTYRGSDIPGLGGVTLFGDYGGARMGALVQCGAQTSPVTVIAKNRDVNQPSQASFAHLAGVGTFTQLGAIIEDNAGELYFVVNSSTLVKLVPGN